MVSMGLGLVVHNDTCPPFRGLHMDLCAAERRLNQAAALHARHLDCAVALRRCGAPIVCPEGGPETGGELEPELVALFGHWAAQPGPCPLFVPREAAQLPAYLRAEKFALAQVCCRGSRGSVWAGLLGTLALLCVAAATWMWLERKGRGQEPRAPIGVLKEASKLVKEQQGLLDNMDRALARWAARHAVAREMEAAYRLKLAEMQFHRAIITREDLDVWNVTGWQTSATRPPQKYPVNLYLWLGAGVMNKVDIGGVYAELAGDLRREAGLSFDRIASPINIAVPKPPDEGEASHARSDLARFRRILVAATARHFPVGGPLFSDSDLDAAFNSWRAQQLQTDTTQPSSGPRVPNAKPRSRSRSRTRSRSKSKTLARRSNTATARSTFSDPAKTKTRPSSRLLTPPSHPQPPDPNPAPKLA